MRIEKVFVITITYGNRFNFLKEVIEAALNEGVNKVIVIDNNSHPESRRKLKKYEKENPNVKVIYLPNNIGSAGGYKRGLQEAYKDSECEFIWLLDDDNKPLKNALKILFDFWRSINIKEKEKKVVLLSYRENRESYKKAIFFNQPNMVLGKKNSFFGFHVLDLPKKTLGVIKRKLNIQTFTENKNIKSGLVAVAPYGGMFFHKSLIDTIGYPNENFFVYVDDHEWSYRITKNNGKIFLVLDSVIEDIDTSWHLGNLHVFKTLAKGTDFRVYYSIRNRTFFEKTILVKNYFVYWINMKTFLGILKFFIDNRRYSLIKNAIKDGLNYNLGKKYNL